MIIWRKYSTVGIPFIFILLNALGIFILHGDLFLHGNLPSTEKICRSYICGENEIYRFFVFGIFILFVLIVFSKIVKLEASDSRPVYFPITSFFLILFAISIGIFGNTSAHVSFVASLALAITVIFLYSQFRRKEIFLLACIFLLLFFFYFLFLEYSENSAKPELYWGVLLAILMGLLSSFITLIGAVHPIKKDQETSIKLILSFGTFLSLVIALVIYFLSQKEEVLSLIRDILSQKEEGFSVIQDILSQKEQRFSVIQDILPIGSGIVPVLSYYYGGFFSLERSKLKNSDYWNFPFLLSGLIISFLLGFIFGSLPFAFKHSYHYPLMCSFWILIASYFSLLNEKTWYPSKYFIKTKNFLTK